MCVCVWRYVCGDMCVCGVLMCVCGVSICVCVEICVCVMCMCLCYVYVCVNENVTEQNEQMTHVSKSSRECECVNV